jgi:hypothetical protein
MKALLLSKPDKDRLRNEALRCADRRTGNAMPPNLGGAIAPFVFAARTLDGHNAILVVTVAAFVKMGKVDGLTAALTRHRPVFDFIPQSKVAHSPTPSLRGLNSISELKAKGEAARA